MLHLAQWQALVLNNATIRPVDDNLLVGKNPSRCLTANWFTAHVASFGYAADVIV